jgi:hypothetical protein
MKKLLLSATAAALTLSLSVAAEAQAKGKGHGAKAQAGASAGMKASGKVRDLRRAPTDERRSLLSRTRGAANVDRRIDVNANGIPDYRERALSDANNNGIADFRERRLVDINQNGVADWRERLIDRDRDGVDERAEGQYGGHICPPGLAKKSPACVPPGQARRLFTEGQRVPNGYRYYTDLDDIPEAYRGSIPDIYRSGAYRYIYRDDSVYVVDRATSVIRDIISLTN